MDRFWRVVACCVVLVSLSFAAFASLGVAGAADPASTAAAGNAVGWLKTQQQSDGGFELAGFPGFETPDAILAIAENAQTGSTWSTAQALAAVQAVHVGGGSGLTPLDAIDAFAHTAISPQQAAKLIVLVAAPLGLDAGAFHPGSGGTPPVNLLTTLDPAGCAGNPANYGLFNGTLYGALAKKLVCGAPNAAVLATIRAAQRADGGWNFAGDQDPATDSDVDTTSLAVQSLVAGGAAWNDPAVTKALAFLAAQHQADGAWQSFGADDPNSTAVGSIAVTAIGFDVTSSCWRDTAVPSAKGSTYGDPVAWIRTRQQSDGRIASPNDSFGINTFATSQSVEGMLRTWLPIARASGAPTCTTVSSTPTVTAAPPASVAAAVVVAPSFTG
ncbi:MAG TPA: hypothetical protein VFC99_22030 [Acidimicrobiia bacterium]|nr:hypothetical protein [Acidimicrobiia bacterium]